MKVRTNYPRATKPIREPIVLSFEEMHAIAAKAGRFEAMIRVLSDCGRLGELLAIQRADFDGESFWLAGSVYNGVFIPGDQPTKKHVRRLPCPPSAADLVRALPTRIDPPLLFPTPTGKIWWERNFKRDVWYPTLEAGPGSIVDAGDAT